MLLLVRKELCPGFLDVGGRVCRQGDGRLRDVVLIQHRHHMFNDALSCVRTLELLAREGDLHEFGRVLTDEACRNAHESRLQR